MEASFQTTTMMEVQVEAAELAHKTPPRVPPKPSSKSPTHHSVVTKVTGGRQQSPSPVRHVKAPTPTPVRWVEPGSFFISTDILHLRWMSCDLQACPSHFITLSSPLGPARPSSPHTGRWLLVEKCCRPGSRASSRLRPVIPV